MSTRKKPSRKARLEALGEAELARRRASKAMHDRTQVIVPAMKASTADDVSGYGYFDEGRVEIFEYSSEMQLDDEASARRAGENG